MAFPILGTPRPQFSNSTGVLAAGTVQVLSPTDDTNATYYPTADDADAGTNGQTGNITLDANGMTPDGFFGPYGSTYKIIVQDSSGSTIWTETDLGFNSAFDADTTYTIPTDYATLQAAFDALSKVPVKQGTVITLNIESGHALTAGYRLENGDFSHFRITSTDATVSITTGFTLVSNTDLPSGSVPRSNDLGFLHINCRAPVWDIVVDCANKNMSAALEYDHCSTGIIRATKGAKNVDDGSTNGTCLRVTSGSRVEAAGGVFTGALGSNINVTLSSMVNLQGATCSGSTNNANIDVSRGSVVHCKDADASGSGNTEGLYARRSWVSAEGINVGGTVTGIFAGIGAVVTAHQSTFTGCTADVKVEQGARVDVTGATKSGVALDRADSVGPNGAGGTSALRAFNKMQHGCLISDSDANYEQETVTGTVTLNPSINTSFLNSSAGAVSATLGNGFFPGQIKTIGMSNATNSSTLSVTNHSTSSPEVFTFAQVTDTLVLLWNGSLWITIANVNVGT